MTRNPPDRNHLLALARALECIKAKKFASAEDIGWQVAEADPHNADAFFIAGIAANALGNPLLARDRLDRAIALQPERAEYWNHRGVILHALRQPEAAMRDFQAALRLDPSDGSTQANLARLFMEQGEPRQALQAIRVAHDQTPDDPTVLADMAVILVACKKTAQALPLYEQALRLDPNNPEIHFNYSRALLMAGRYPEGWRENEWRWRANHYKTVNKQLPAPLWDGSDLNGKQIAMLSEQGFGDALQFIRYAPLLQQENNTVIVWCRPELTRLFQGAQGVDQAVSGDHPLPRIDCCIPMWSLPLRFHTTLETIPAAHCLRMPSDWTPPLPEKPAGKRVGLVWSGHNQKTLRLQDLLPLLALAPVEWHSLQHGPEAALAARHGLRDWSAHLTDFAATATIMSRMDLIITIDTAAAHLAGSLGLPFWLLTHATADWRWGETGTTTPWYPTARLFRQKEPGQWQEVVAQLTDALQQELLHG